MNRANTGGTEREPTRDELLAMAYVDGELEESAAREFEERLKTSSELTREIAELRRLAVLARQVAPPEPMDYEWEKLAKDPIQRSGLSLGWALLFVGVIGHMGWFLWALFSGDADTGLKIVTGALAAGALILFLIVLRQRLKTLPYDPYRDVQR